MLGMGVGIAVAIVMMHGPIEGRCRALELAQGI